jgi:hypothetical protein
LASENNSAAWREGGGDEKKKGKGAEMDGTVVAQRIRTGDRFAFFTMSS